MAEFQGRILSVASECVPLIKTGGLADVVGALPAALEALGWQVRTILPAYRGLLARLDGAQVIWSDPDLFGGPTQAWLGQVGGMQVVLMDAPHLFDRPGGPYSAGGADHPDNPERFAALCWAAAALARGQGTDGWQADVLHAHDWQAGFAPAYLRYGGDTRVRSVVTIHNMAFQGIAPADRLVGLRLPASGFTVDGFEYWGNISSLKAGLVTADAITTVSPTYADELMRPEFGLGLEGVIAARANVLQGVLNGVDTSVWNPETDPDVAGYSAARMAGKATMRDRLRAEFGLGEVPGPLAIVVSRLTPQKGIDLLPAVLPDFVAAGGGLAVLGTGDAALERAMLALAEDHPGRVAVRIGYDEDLSHRMFAGADAVLVPSRFEPCGLTQMYGLRYGAVPVVSATGGLADTVIGATPASLAAGAATGVTFHPVDALALSQALRRLVSLHANPTQWKALQRRGMRAELGWGQAAARYGAIYRGLIG